MLESIKQIRSEIDVPIGRARELLEQFNGDVAAARDAAFRAAIAPIIEATGVSEEEAKNAFIVHRQDVRRAIEVLRFAADPKKCEKASRPTVGEMKDKISGADDIYELMGCCGIDAEFSDPEADEMPAPIVVLTNFHAFYSLYLSDDSQIFEQPAATKDAILASLVTLGVPDIAERVARDIADGRTHSENFDYLLKREDDLLALVRRYASANAKTILKWRNRGGLP